MVISKRNFLKGCGASVLAVVPLKVDVAGSFPSLASPTAFAKNENGNGGGNGNGNGGNGGGNGNGSGGGNGNGGNSGGNGNGNGGSGGGNGNGNSGGNGSGNSRSSSNGAGRADRVPSTPGVRATEDTDGSIDVRHTNGITETLRAGRYIMKDSKGRTIINRRATSADSTRLARLLR
ncbi:hypothetical protein [Rhizobium sp. WYJ-E13]|uniref:hypothetical protein n=1 Tax=Rhizobium sp. WYJ-E13 TaxID=2849093 RepID=UPI001C1ED721|nr:hypothetical protein [Rhizobium sp. WYJ-E13]QWW70383.1 hypothetical protein KQ933_26555 [Rhizobium sp. WYJ-E13]